jgi:hypothetical protein
MSDQYLSGLPGFGPGNNPYSVPTFPVNVQGVNLVPTATVTGPKFSTLALALIGMGALTFLLPRGTGEWVPIIFLGGYAATQSGFVNGLLESANTKLGNN